MIRWTILEVRPQAMNEARPQVIDEVWRETANALTLHFAITRVGTWTRVGVLNWAKEHR